MYMFAKFSRSFKMLSRRDLRSVKNKIEIAATKRKKYKVKHQQQHAHTYLSMTSPTPEIFHPQDEAS